MFAVVRQMKVRGVIALPGSATSGDDNTAYDNINHLTAFRRGTLSASAHNSGVLDTVSTLNTLSNSSQSYTLDAVGNATAITTDGTNQTNTVNSQNEETAAGSNTLAFDNNGNTTTDDQGHTLVYNAWNQLVTVKNGGTTIASYVYDADGNRIQQTESSTTTDFYFSSAGQDLEDRQGSTVVAQYVWGLGYVNSLVLRDDNSTSGSYGKSSSGLGRRLFVQQDTDWNVTALVDTSGTVKERFIQTPYGVATVLTAAWASTTDAYSWVYGFQGGRYDPVTGMFHFGARDYSPTLQRWVQEDPIGYVSGVDKFQFAESDPPRFSDSTGLDVAVTGAAGHAGIEVQVWGYDCDKHRMVVKGKLHVDYHAKGFMGTAGQGHDGNVITGTQGQLDWTYTPTDNLSAIAPRQITGPTPWQTMLNDSSLVGYLSEAMGNPPALTSAMQGGQYAVGTADATGNWAEYSAVSCNCYMFVAQMLTNWGKTQVGLDGNLIWNIDQLLNGVDRAYPKAKKGPTSPPGRKPPSCPCGS